MPLLVSVVALFRLPARNAFRDTRTATARLNATLSESLAGMPIIQVFGQERAAYQEFDEVNQTYRHANYRSIRYDAMTYAIIEGLATMSIGTMVYFGARLVVGGDFEIGVFVAFVDYLRRFFGPITELSTKYTVIQQAIRMAAANPWLLPRNHLLHAAIVRAEAGDVGGIAELFDALRQPYREQPQYAHLAGKRPDWARRTPGCLALSCSS